MKKFKILLLMILSIIIIKPLNINAIDNFEILDLEVLIDVKSDGTYDVVEKFKMNFFSPALGFYRDLSSIHHMSFMVDNKVINKTYNFPITNIKLIGDEYKVESQFNGEQIIVGPDYGPRFTGIKEYEISYTIHTQAFDIANQKEVFFQNLVSDWNATIKNFKSVTTFEKPVDLSLLIVKGQDQFSELEVMCETFDKGFVCSYFDDLNFGKGNGITAQLPLSDNYFNRKTDTKYYVFGIISSLFVLALSMYFKANYAQEKHIVQQVTFNPPKGYNSAMVGYVIDDKVDNEDIYSLLFYWANQGLISINEVAKDKLIFNKLKDISDDAKSFEKNIFNLMFYKEGDITTSNWQERDLYSKLLIAHSEIKNSVNKKGSMYDKPNVKYKWLSVISAILVLSIFYFSIYKFNFINISKAFIVSIISSFITFIAYVIFDQINQNNIRNSKNNFLSILLSSIFGVILGFVFSSILNYFLGFRINTIYFTLVTTLLFISFNFASRMKVRSDYGARIYGEVLGLKSFIKYAKVDELLVMQNENPFLYYDILPYAYAFNMSDLWSDHFKTIEIINSPYYTSYQSPGYTNYFMMRSLSQSLHATNTQIIPKVSSSSGGGNFSSGGGFSSGGFSGGGGFGGGGGGGR